jgi:hypothetical protein
MICRKLSKVALLLLRTSGCRLLMRWWASRRNWDETLTRAS